MNNVLGLDPFCDQRGVPFLPKDLRPEGKGPGSSWKGRKRGKKETP